MGEGAEKAHSRGEKTRENILNTSKELFAQHGYHAVTTRRIASLCKCNLAAIAYHFGGKEGLYREVLNEIARLHFQKSEPFYKRLVVQIAESDGDRHRLADAARRFVFDEIRLFLTHPDSTWIHAIIHRELTMPSEHVGMVYESCVSPMNRALRELYSAARGVETDSLECIVSAKLIITQLTAFLTYRQAFMTDLGWDRYSPERIERLSAVTADSILKMLHLDPAQPK